MACDFKGWLWLLLIAVLLSMLPETAVWAKEGWRGGIMDKVTHYKNEITVDAPPSVVYRLITEGDQIARWAHDDRLKIAFPLGTEARNGMQIQFTIKVPTNPSWMVEIRELKTDERMITDVVDGIFTGTLSFYLKKKGEGTMLIHVAEIDPQGPFITVAWEVAGERIHQEKMEMILERIRDLAEEDWSLISSKD